MRKDGTRFWANVVIDAIHDGTGRLIGFAKITRDLTERRAAEEQLRQAQKMEAIGQLTGGVAHDFNNLLTAIIGNLEMLATLLPAGEPGRRYAEGALRAASRGSRLTEHLLAFSRRQEIRPEIVGINDLLRESLMLCQKTVGEGVEIALASAGRGLALPDRPRPVRRRRPEPCRERARRDEQIGPPHPAHRKRDDNQR